MKKEVFIFGIFLVLITGCLNSGNNEFGNQNAGDTTQIQESHNRTGWNRTGDRRNNLTNMRDRFNMANMSARLTEIRARLNLSANASEEELMAALQKIREERGIQPLGNPSENPPNNPQ